MNLIYNIIKKIHIKALIKENRRRESPQYGQCWIVTPYSLLVTVTILLFSDNENCNNYFYCLINEIVTSLQLKSNCNTVTSC